MNRLAHADSLYLRQHADNPVHWWPWCDAALAEARQRDCPILLSIGYAACHWCHVMAHESFADAATAAAMNAGYVCIKLDREQRPDLDQIYQRAQLALSGRPGGWPLTAFLDPHTLAPIFIGTYFPPQPRHGLPAFGQLLAAIAEAWRTRRDAISAQAGHWQAWLQQDDSNALSDATSAPLATALQQIRARHDAAHGGHRGAPKFPACSELELLLDLLLTQADADARSELAPMIGGTLDGMARGGLRDALDGGFFRYCVDAHWGIPHFEKMLYDNAQLLAVYARAARRLQRPDWAAVARHCAQWLAQVLTRDDGALAAALDADSPGGEGAYYVWQRAQIEAALPDATQRALAARTWNLAQPPNFEGQAWHLQLATETPLAEDAARTALRERLLEARVQRPPPARDDKLLTGWNALACAGLFRAARALDDAALAAQAQRVLQVLGAKAWRDGLLYAQADSAGSSSGFLDDYAALLDALCAALIWRWTDDHLQWAQQLATQMIARFADDARGGFFFSAHEHATPLARPRSFEDASTPSGNALAAGALLTLGHLCGETSWLDQAQRTVQAGLAALGEHPAAGCALLRVAHALQQPGVHLVLRVTADEWPHWSAAITALQRDARVAVYVIPASAAALPPLLAARLWQAGGVAYWCEGLTCRAPIADPQALPQPA